VQTKSQPKWPIVARDDEFRRALAALDGTTECHGVALVGDSGVGNRAAGDRARRCPQFPNPLGKYRLHHR